MPDDKEPVRVSISRVQVLLGIVIVGLLAFIVGVPALPVAGGTGSRTDDGGETPASGADTSPEVESDQQATGEFGKSNASVGAVGSAHEHAAFLVAINGRRIDFSRRQFQLRSEKIHFEGGNGTIFHKHADGVTIDYALNTLGMDLTADCLRLVTGKSYCRGDGNLTIAANNRTVPRWYEIQDGDTVLIAYRGRQ